MTSLPALDLLLDEHQRRRFDQTLEHAIEAGAGDAGIQEALDSAALSESERLLFRFAYALLRGWGPGLRPDDLWGLHPATAARLLAAMAWSVDPEHPMELLHSAVRRVQGLSPQGKEGE